MPPFMRGRYFSLRNFLMGMATLLVTPLAGWIISSGRSRRHGFSAFGLPDCLCAGLYCGDAGYTAGRPPQLLSHPSRDPAAAATPRAQSIGQIMRGSHALAAFVVHAFVWNMSLQIPGPTTISISLHIWAARLRV